MANNLWVLVVVQQHDDPLVIGPYEAMPLTEQFKEMQAKARKEFPRRRGYLSWAFVPMVSPTKELALQ